MKKTIQKAPAPENQDIAAKPQFSPVMEKRRAERMRRLASLHAQIRQKGGFR